MISIIVTEEDHCRSVESWLRQRMPSATAGYLHQLVKNGHLAVNGAPATELAPLLVGDRLTLKESGRTRSLLSAKPPAIDILYEDDMVVCLNKPPGLAMHPAAEVGPENLVDSATAYIRLREQAVHPDRQPAGYRLRPVNRLDRGTSGSVLLAKSATAAGIFGKLVMEEGLGKLYLALVNGRIEGHGLIDLPVEEKDAVTLFRSIFSDRSASLVALWPQTGRMHQLRQHMRHIGHPILGDRRYGGPPLAGSPGFPLHAFRTWFTHPVDGRDTVIHAPLPPVFLELLHRLTGERCLPILGSLPDLSES